MPEIGFKRRTYMNDGVLIINGASRAWRDQVRHHCHAGSWSVADLVLQPETKRMVVKTMAPFGVVSIIRHLVFRGPRRGP